MILLLFKTLTPKLPKSGKWVMRGMIKARKKKKKRVTKRMNQKKKKKVMLLKMMKISNGTMMIRVFSCSHLIAHKSLGLP